MVAIIPPVDIEDRWPQIPRYGLFSACLGPLSLPDTHARGGGLRYRSAVSRIPEGFEVLCEESKVTFRDPCGDYVTGTPFTVLSNVATSIVGFTEDEYRSVLLQRLMAGEQLAVEAIFCSGLVGASPSLVNNIPLATPLAAAASVMEGVGALEAWLYAQYGPRGVLHVPLALAPRFQEKSLLIRDGVTWRTALGTAVAFGNYTGEDNDGDAPAAGTTNLYITGATTVWRTPDSQIEVSPYQGGIYYPENQLVGFARREYVVTHNQMLAVCNVTIAGV